MKIKYTLSLLIMMLASIQSFSQKKNSQVKVESSLIVQKQFEEDKKNGTIKYYSYGMIPSTVNKKLFHDTYQIKIIDRGCVADINEVSYNQLLERYFLTHFKKDLNTALQECNKLIKSQ